MSKHSDKVLLQHMLLAGQRIGEYLHGLSKDRFMAYSMVQDAVVRQLEIIGEAASKLSDDFCRAHPEIPWRRVVGMRNRLIHGYFGVDYDIVWETATSEVPRLLEQIRSILAEAHDEL